MLSYLFRLAVVLAIASQSVSRSCADESEKTTERSDRFVRILTNDSGDPLALQTSILRYQDRAGRVQVDLIGAVHIGERDYYESLNGRFEQYDALLYELVAPEGADPSQSAERSTSPVSSLQRGLQQLLELEYQLSRIRYDAPNFVHADLSPEEFFSSMERKGESVLQLVFRMLGQSVAMSSRPEAAGSDLKLLAAFFSRDRALGLKRVMAAQFTDLEAAAGALDGPGGSTLISARNQRAMDVLAKQLEMGRQKIGIFYGAAHLPDMEKRLLERFSLRLVNQQWLSAWRLQ